MGEKHIRDLFGNIKLKMKKKIMISVDPDLHKPGVSVYNSETKTLLDCRTLYLWELFHFIEYV